MIKVNKLKSNPNNPRVIKDDKFHKLVKSIKEFPEMMEKRPLVCVTDTDGKLYPLGGNQRLKAIQYLGYEEIPNTWVTLADEWSEEQRKDFTIKDNVSFGDWDIEALKDWDNIDILDINWTDEIKKPKQNQETVKIEAYNKQHILISYSPQFHDEITLILQQLELNPNIEIEKSAN